MGDTIHYKQLGLGAAFLVFGLGIYVFDRNFIPFLGLSADNYLDTSVNLGSWSGFLPSFIHPLAFSLLCAGFLGTSRKVVLIICTSWGLVHFGLEFAQMKSLYPWFSIVFDSVGREHLLVMYIENYCLAGVFDTMDLAAVLAGCVLSFFLIRSTYNKKRISHVYR